MCGMCVHADNVTKEGMPALLDEVVGKTCTTEDIGVLDHMEPAHSENASLTAYVECLQVAQVCLGWTSAKNQKQSKS